MKALLIVAVVLTAATAQAAPVGERHLKGSEPSAALRDAGHSTDVRVTVWYPAPDGVKEARIDLGPPAKPLFIVGQVAEGAPFADARKRPVILFSHGFGGAARMMGWFGVPMARAGYIVVAVDHPGNNGVDKMTTSGAIMSWDRAKDLRAALEAVKADPAIGPHLDLKRVGVAGFSAGGFTSLVAAGARTDMFRFLGFCHEHPTDGVCAPQKEYKLTMAEAEAALRSPELAGEVAHAGDDLSIPGVKAAFAMAPAIVQGLDPASLKRMKVPVAIFLGDADPVAPPDTNGRVAAKAIPGAQLTELPGVKHYDFLSTCTDMGRAVVEICKDERPQDPTHDAAITAALAFFGKALGKPPV